jgi:hypothetical protein
MLYQYALSAIPICACLDAIIVLVISVKAKKLTNYSLVSFFAFICAEIKPVDLWLDSKKDFK